MKIYLLILLSSFVPLSANPGDFVKDVIIRDFDVKIPSIKKEIISNNLDLFQMKSDYFPIAEIEIHLYGGESSVGKHSMELPAVLANVLRFGGSKKYPEEKFLHKLEFYGAQMAVEAEYRKIKLQVSFLTKDTDQILELIEDLILNPNLSEISIDNAKKKIAEQIKRRNDSTESLGFRKTRELIYGKLIAGKPYQINSLQKIKKEDLEEFWKNQIQSKRKAILTRGDFSEPKVKSAIDRMFKLNGKSHDKFPEEKLDFDSLNAGYQSGKFKNIIVDKKVNQSAVIMAGILPQHNHPDFYAIQLLNYIIGGGGFNSYFMQQIRSDRGLAYSAVSYPSFKSDHGTIFFYSMTKNETAGEVYSLMNQILTEESFAKIKEQELENAKNAINNQFVFLFSGDDQILTNTLRFEEDSMPREYLHNYRSEIKKVSLTDLRRVGKKYFAGAGLKTVIVGPASSLRLKLKGETKTIGPEDLILE